MASGGILHPVAKPGSFKTRGKRPDPKRGVENGCLESSARAGTPVPHSFPKAKGPSLGRGRKIVRAGDRKGQSQPVSSAPCSPARLGNSQWLQLNLVFTSSVLDTCMQEVPPECCLKVDDDLPFPRQSSPPLSALL